MSAAISRLTVGIVLIFVSVLLAADLILAIAPGNDSATLNARKKVTEALAVQASALASRAELVVLGVVMEEVVLRNEDVLSLALVGRNGNALAETKNHAVLWRGADTEKSTPSHARVQIFNDGKPWGELQLRYVALGGSWWGPWVPLAKLVGLCGAMAFVGCYIFLARSLRQLDPSSVVPGRVKATLDVLTEGVVLVDKGGRVVLANSAFSERVATREDALLGRRLSDLGWHRRRSDGEDQDFPWRQALQSGEIRSGRNLSYPGKEGGHVSFVVNSSPILDEDGAPRGAMATFTDVTETERKNQQLEELLEERRRSEAAIMRQNERLEVLATRDPLTNCYNRRAFFERVNQILASAATNDTAASCIMCDIDHFKLVNDNYGHSVGDDVIRFFAGVLNDGVRTIDIVGRYGGEEFCIVLPGEQAATTALVADRLRAAMEAGGSAVLPGESTGSLTASFGVAGWRPGEEKADALVARADEALYEAKRAGRNRVAVFGAAVSAQDAEAPASKASA